MRSDRQLFKYMLSLIEKPKQVKDFRKDQGKRHPLWIVLVVIILGTMLGYSGYRELGEFAKVISYHLSEASYQFTVYWTATPRLWQH
jgi:type VI protein secretion system component VasF